MRRFHTVEGLRSYLKSLRHDKTMGLVPTMGALHQGHLSLIKDSVAENDLTVVTIYVNPLQFSPAEDLDRYPHDWEKDRQLCEELGVDVVFVPTVEEMGGEMLATQVMPPESMMSVLCGASRPGHFSGVATIVTKLFNIVQPDRAYFGEKDAQQLAIIRRLVADLSIPVEIKACATVREASGLAYSSRNQYLTPEQKSQAEILGASLHEAKRAFAKGERASSVLLEIVKTKLSTIPAVKVEYVALVHPDTLTPVAKIEEVGLLVIAAHVGSTRLIDNLILRHRRPIIAIDGPAGAGKSTVSRRVAQNLGLVYLDTGAMYRAVTWLVLNSGIAVDDEPAIAELVSQAQLNLIAPDSPSSPVVVQINHQDVTQAIRTPRVTAQVSVVAKLEVVRQAMVQQQRIWGKKGGLVADGRDMGTNVFPDAELKVFLTASATERARRRLKDLRQKGEQELSLEELEERIKKRDWLDSTRKISPLRKADTAIEINTDGLTIEEVIDKIIGLFEQGKS